MAKWHFTHKPLGVKTRDPIAGEFFASEAIDDAGTALIREAIQNSLDARARDADRVRIRVYVSGEQGALTRARHDRWFSSAWPHLLAPRNGLKTELLSPQGSCRYLSFEDFGTTGLTGDPRQGEEIPGTRNAFFYFFRAEGRTDKHSDDRGRWGIGKQVFPRSSRAQMFMGYTESDRGGLLMGGCILKNHSVNGESFLPDGYWGNIDGVADRQIVVPESDAKVLQQFRSDFSLQREPGRRGLSIVVPWLDYDQEDPEGTSGFARDVLAIDVMSEYFLPIIEGRLEVEVADPDGARQLSSETYGQCFQAIRESGRVRAADRLTQLAARIALIERVRDDHQCERVSIPDGGENRPKWTDSMLPPAEAARVRNALEAGRVVQVEAEMTIRVKAGTAQLGRFLCYLAKGAQSEQPCFIREDLLISDVRGRRTPGHTAIVRVDAGPVASMLGDAEGPAHTSWNKASRNFKDKYVFGPGMIDFVMHFPEQLFGRIYGRAREVERTLLLDLFHDPGPEQEADPEEIPQRPRGGAGAAGRVVGPDSRPVGPFPRRPPAVRVDMQPTGFSIHAGEVPPPMGSIVTVQTAYVTTKGDPFKKYRRQDFRMDQLGPHYQGCRPVKCADNYLIFRVLDANFRVSVEGFDRNRDVEVSVRIRQEAGAVGHQDE